MTVAATPAALRSAIRWDLIQDGLHDWLAGVTGLPVIFGRQPGGALQPARAYVAVDLISGPISQGRDGAGLQSFVGTTPTPPVGQEVKSVIFGLKTLGFSVNVFSDSKRYADNAMSYVSAIQASLSLESVIAQLNASGLAARSFGDIVNLTELQESIWVSRASLEIEFTTAMFTAAGDSEGYIGEVIGTGTVVEGNPNASSVSVPTDVKGL